MDPIVDEHPGVELAVGMSNNTKGMTVALQTNHVILNNLTEIIPSDSCCAWLKCCQHAAGDFFYLLHWKVADISTTMVYVQDCHKP